MIFDNFASAQAMLLWAAYAIALVLGLVANKTNFCTMGAVSDWVNMGDLSRFRAWMLAIAVAMIGVAVLEPAGLVSADGSFPPYRGSQLIWAENLLGGLIFGIGMTLASGCANKNLIRAGAGNLKSIMVLAIIAVIAYFMTNPFPGTDQTLYTLLFYGWMQPLVISLSTSQDLGSLFATSDNLVEMRSAIGSILGAALLVFVFWPAEFRKSFDNILGGLVVGLVVLAGWYVSSSVSIDLDGEIFSLQSYVQQWDFLADSEVGKPADSRPLAAQSYTFVNPTGQMYGYINSGFSKALVTFGVMAVMGVITGSFLWSLLSRTFRVEWFASFQDFKNHAIGAVLMGFGGVLALGCTIGQAITGISTLALGSFIAFIGIVIGSALTMKTQYYKLVYEEEASWSAALITSLVDLHLLPSALRKLDAV